MHLRSFYHGLILSIAAIAVLSIVGCGDASPIGSDVLEGDRLDIRYTDTLPLGGKIVSSDPVPTFRITTDSTTSISLRNRIVGRLDDPFLGVSSTEVYMQFSLSTVEPVFDNATLDSVVLILGYDSIGFYGEHDIAHRVEVLELVEDFPMVSTFNSDQTIATGNVIGSRVMIPSFRDSVSITNHNDDMDAAKVQPQLRIRLDNALGDALITDSTLILSNDNFRSFFKGIALSSEPQSGSGTIGIDQNSTINGIYIYYTTQDTVRRTYRLFTNNRVASNIVHDYAGAPVQNLIDSPNSEFLAVQGMAGLNSVVTLENLDPIIDQVINYAEIVAIIAFDSNLEPEVYEPRNVIALEQNADGDNVAISDVSLGQTRGDLLRFFGGTPQDTMINGEARQFMRFNITSHIKDIQNDPNVSKDIILSALAKVENPGRTILYGPQHPFYPMKLNVTFTKTK